MNKGLRLNARVDYPERKFIVGNRDLMNKGLRHCSTFFSFTFDIYFVRNRDLMNKGLRPEYC